MRSMKPWDIKNKLKEHRITQKTIANKLKVSESNISLVISQKSKSRKVQESIAKAIGKDFGKVWGYE